MAYKRDGRIYTDKGQPTYPAPAPSNLEEELLGILNGLVAPFGIADSSRVGQALSQLKQLILKDVLELVGPDKDLTIKDIFGDDPRNNIGGGEMEAMHNQNSGRRKLRIELRQSARKRYQ